MALPLTLKRLALAASFAGLGLWSLSSGLSVNSEVRAVNTSLAPMNQEAEVRSVVDRFFRLAKEHNWDGIGELFAEDFEIYTDDAVSFRKTEYVKLLKEDDMDLRRMELHDLEVKVSSDGSMAWTKYRGYFESFSHGEVSRVQTAETLIFEKTGGRWYIVRAHASIKPASKP